MPTPLQALANVANAYQALPKLITGGQPSPDIFEALKAAGVEVVLDIRDPMEARPFDEKLLVEKLGMRYVNIPVVAGYLHEALLDQILGILREEKDREVLFHCASGNRVGGALIPYFVLDQGLSEDDAMEAAMRVGLRNAELMDWGMRYARGRAKRDGK